MAIRIVDCTAPAGQDGVPVKPSELPHGVIAPPERVLEIVAAEKVKFPPEIFTPAAEERLKNDLTMQFYFDGSGCEVVYRSTPQGLEVLAVGFDEILAFRQRCPREEQPNLSTWLP